MSMEGKFEWLAKKDHIETSGELDPDSGLPNLEELKKKNVALEISLDNLVDTFLPPEVQIGQLEFLLAAVNQISNEEENSNWQSIEVRAHELMKDHGQESVATAIQNRIDSLRENY